MSKLRPVRSDAIDRLVRYTSVMRWLRREVLAFMAMGAIVGCHIISGLDGVDEAAGETGAQGGQGGASSATSSTGAGGSNATSSGTGGCMPSAEDCLNGVDDDCDGNADCDDTDCSSYNCVPLPAGGTLVEPVADPRDCSTELVVATLADCSQCSCSVNSPGSCTHIAHLYSNSTCQGQPDTSVTVMPGAKAGCTSVNVSADGNDTVGALAEEVGVGDASCSPNSANAQMTERYLCSLPNPGNCASDDVCVPAGAVSCVLFDGNVSCPAGFDNKEILYDTAANSCDCDCTIVSQICPTNQHYHLQDNPICDNNGNNVQPSLGCVSWNMSTVLSVENHNEVIPAISAICNGVGGPSIAQDAQTLCCPP